MFDVSTMSAFIAGVLSFFTPCILPMVPFYLSYMAGLSIAQLGDESEIQPGVHRQLVLCSVAFALGVTLVFVGLGLGSTVVGGFLISYRHILSYVFGAVLILFGLHFLGILRISFLYREARLSTSISPSTLGGAFVTGVVFGFGWTPCAGPVLASVLAIAAMKGPGEGALLLGSYGVGMTLPFVIASIFVGPFLRFLSRNRAIVVQTERVIGVMLIVFGVLIATQTVNYISAFMMEIAPGFSKIL